MIEIQYSQKGVLRWYMTHEKTNTILNKMSLGTKSVVYNKTVYV